MNYFHRVILVLLAGLVAACAAPTPSPTATPVDTKTHPNIVFILTDDMAYGDETYMPQLAQWVTSQGATFDHFYVSSSLCCPSRASTLRGQYPHNTHVLSNDPPTGGFGVFNKRGLEDSTIATWLQSAGYRTALIGKYLNGYPRGSKPTYVPKGWNEWDVPAAGSPYGEFNYTLNENGKLVGYGSKPEEYETDVDAGLAVKFIQDATTAKQPFFLYLATYAPHIPAVPAPRHAGMFATVPLPQPPSFNQADVSGSPGYVRDHPLLSSQIQSEIEQYYHQRLQTLQAVDDLIARVGNTLEVAGVLDNTYIVFTSDNGFHLGQHRLPRGKETPYLEDVHVPFMIRGPQVAAGRIISQLSMNNDLAPTFAELGKAAVPAWVDGRSLVPLLFGSQVPVPAWRQAILTERGADPVRTARKATRLAATRTAQGGILEPSDELGNGGQLAETQAPPFEGIITAHYAYVEYDTKEQELYDLDRDPFEIQNLAGSAAHALVQALQEQLHQLTACAGANCRTAEDSAPPIQ